MLYGASALVAAAVGTSTASAQTIGVQGPPCEVDPARGEMRLDLAQGIDVVVLPDGEIGISYVVYDSNPHFPGSERFDVNCTVAGDAQTPFTPTVTNIDSIGGEVDGLALRDPLAPGRTTDGEGGTPEIEISLMINRGVQLWPAAAPVGLRFGQAPDGVIRGNLNTISEDAEAADVDLTVSRPQAAGDPIRPLSYLSASGSAGPDEISFAGGGGLGGPVHASSGSLWGRGGADRLVAGAGGDELEGGEDAAADVLIGGDGADDISPGGGDDVVDGGGGADRLRLLNGPEVRVDLRVNGPQDTGQGVKTIAAIERLFASDGDDRLIGTDGPDELVGGDGDDTVLGLGGDDALNDYTYGADRIRGGAGNDLVGGWFGDDRLYGGPGDDRVIGGDQIDALFGNGGNDRLNAFDEKRFGRVPHGDRRISCGAGDDAAESARIDARDPRPLGC